MVTHGSVVFKYAILLDIRHIAIYQGRFYQFCGISGTSASYCIGSSHKVIDDAFFKID